jgi:hypothetical protein
MELIYQSAVTSRQSAEEVSFVVGWEGASSGYDSRLRLPTEHWRLNSSPAEIVFIGVLKFLIWCVLLVLCWPVALLALILYPLVWILLLPFRLIGIAVEGVFSLLRAIVTLPARLLRV